MDFYSCLELGQVTASCPTEAGVITSFLDTARQYGLPALVKTDYMYLDHLSGS